MANAFTEPLKYRDFRPEYDIDLLGKSLLAMQGQFDKNVDETQGQINSLAEFGNNLVRDVDKKYYNEKVNRLVTNLNNSGLSNFAYNNVKDVAVGYVDQALDDKVMAAYDGSNARAYIMKQAEDTKLKNPEKYSDLNLAYSLADNDAWMQGKVAGQVYKGKRNFVPFEDIEKKRLAVVEKIKPGAYVTYTANGKAQYYTQEGTLITDGRIMEAVDSVDSDPNIQQQGQINAWAQYRNMPAQEKYDRIHSDLTASSQSELQSASIDAEKAQHARDVGNHELAQSFDKSASYHYQKAKTFNTYASTSPQEIADNSHFFGGQVGLYHSARSIAGAFSVNNVTKRELVVNEAYFKTQNLAIEQAKLEREAARFRLEVQDKQHSWANDDFKNSFEVMKAVGEGKISSEQAKEWGILPVEGKPGAVDESSISTVASNSVKDGVAHDYSQNLDAQNAATALGIVEQFKGLNRTQADVYTSLQSLGYNTDNIAKNGFVTHVVKDAQGKPVVQKVSVATAIGDLPEMKITVNDTPQQRATKTQIAIDMRYQDVLSKAKQEADNRTNVLWISQNKPLVDRFNQLKSIEQKYAQERGKVDEFTARNRDLELRKIELEKNKLASLIDGNRLKIQREQYAASKLIKPKQESQVTQIVGQQNTALSRLSPETLREIESKKGDYYQQIHADTPKAYEKLTNVTQKGVTTNNEINADIILSDGKYYLNPQLKAPYGKYSISSNQIVDEKTGAYNVKNLIALSDDDVSRLSATPVGRKMLAMRQSEAYGTRNNILNNSVAEKEIVYPFSKEAIIAGNKVSMTPHLVTTPKVGGGTETKLFYQGSNGKKYFSEIWDTPVQAEESMKKFMLDARQ